MSKSTTIIFAFLLMLMFMGCQEEEVAQSLSGDPSGLTGNVELMIASFDDHSELSYYLIPNVGDKIQLIFEEDPKLESDDRITVFGKKNADDVLFVDRFEFVARQLQSLEVPGELRPPMLHKVAVLLIKGTTITKDSALSSIGQTNKFYQENSNGIDSYEGAVFGPYDIDSHDCGSRYRQIKDDALAAFAAEGHKESSYTHITFVIPSGTGCGWGGLGQVGRPSRPARFTWYNNWFSCSVVAHEIGHNVGFYHSHSLKCGTEIYTASGQNCKMKEYGHPFDNMGGGGCDTHYSAPQKQYQGWLETCNDVTSGGSGVFNLSPLEGTCGVRSLRIPVPGENNYYYIEYRKDDAGEFAGAKGKDRVLVAVSSDGLERRPDMSVLDFHADTDTFNDAWLEEGVNYTLPGGVDIQLLSLGTTAKVRVDMSSSKQHTCAGGSKPPVADDGSIGVGCTDDCATDADGDGTVDCHDSCPDDSTKVEPGICGCGQPEGTCVANDKRYEAEDRTQENGCRKATNHAGYTGSGFIDFGGNGTWIEWNNIAATHAAEYSLTFRYANAGSTPRQADIFVNGQHQGSILFSSTGSWTTWKNDNAKVQLSQGANTVRIKANTGSGGPNLDHMVVFGITPPEDDCPDDPDKLEPGACGCGVPDTDSDGDSAADCQDNCPDDPNKTEPGSCGCGVPEGTCDGAHNIALGKNTSQSSIAWNGASSRAVDGNTSGNWGDGSITHTDRDANSWWQVDLGAAHSISGITIWNRKDCCSNRLSNFDVDYLDAQGQVIASRNHPGQAAAETNMALAARGVYKVRIQLNGTNYLSLAEVQVWGTVDNGGSEKCVVANEHSLASLICPAGSTISGIGFASYGLPIGSCDAGFEEGTCHAASSIAKVEETCLDKATCAVSASNGIFGDPCAGKAKRLAIEYTCGGDIDDECPDDPAKTEPGICGCGVPDTDDDGDGFVFCEDGCPSDPGKQDPGKCGCGKAEGSCTDVKGGGLKGTYFNNIDFTSQAFERVDPTIDFDWGRGAPDTSMESDTFSVIWTGYIKPRYTEKFTFYTMSDDGVRLWVNNQLLNNDWTNHAPRENSGTITLEAGKLYPIRMEYFENGGGAVAKLLWSSTSQSKAIVEKEALYSKLPSP